MRWIVGFILALAMPITATATDVVVRQRVVQFSPETYLGLQGYYSHGQKLLAQRAQEESDAVKELREQNRILRDLVNAVLARNNGEVAPVPTPVPPPEPELQKRVESLYLSKCAKCHGDTKQDGGLRLVQNGKIWFNPKDELELASRVVTHHRVNGVGLNDGEARMPKGAPQLSDDEVELLRLWALDKSIEVLNKKE